ncbi:MAG: hypothetical protein ABDI07_08865 [Candidatus Kryptonium sp.]
MSGVKYSGIQLEQERKDRQEALAKINAIMSNIIALKNHITDMLKEIPDGVKDSFPEEISKINKFLTKTLPEFSKELNSAELNKIVETLLSINNEGNEAISQLVEIKEVKREKKAKELIKNLEALKSEIKAMEELFKKWKPDEFRIMSEHLNELRLLVEKGEFIKVEDEIKSFKNNISQKKEEVLNLQAQDEQRWYVVEALRKVCMEMGWGEVKEPSLEDSNNPASPIIYIVQTYYAGEMRFYLTLEGIKVNSPISTEEQACYKEFGKLSEELKNFGIITKFESIERSEEPKLTQKSERDLPDSAEEISREL